MCSKKIFSSPKPKEVQAPPAPTPAVAQAAPSSGTPEGSIMNQATENTQAKGKRRLTINRNSVGTGVNL